LTPILLSAVLFTVIYPLYNAFAESSDNEEVDNDEETEDEETEDEETEDEVDCNDDEELKDGDCVPIECDPDEELKDGDCVPIECDPDEELKDGDCVPIQNALTLSSVPSDSVLKLDSIREVKLGDPIKVNGKLVDDANDEGIDGKTVTLAVTGIENLPDESKTDVTEGGGVFTFTIPGNAQIGDLVKFKAHFNGDDEYSKSDSNEVSYQAQGGIATSIVDLKVIPGDAITVQGTLKTESDGTGIDGKTVTLAVTGIENLPDESKTDVTEGGGVFTFTIPGNALHDVSRGSGILDPIRPPIDSVKFKAHFNGDDEYSKSDSNEVSYPPNGGIPTDMPRVEVRDVVLGESANTVETKLPTPGDTIPSGNNSEPCKFHHFVKPIHGDNLNEIESKGSELIYKAKDKSKTKTFEYSMIYDCPNPAPPPEPEPIPTPSPPDTTPPGAPEIESPSPGTQKIAISQISGSAEEGSTVTVFNGGSTIDTTTADRNFHWSLTIGTPLGEGTYNFTAKATDAAGNTGDPSSDVNVKVDTTGPTIIATPPGEYYANSPVVTLSSNDPDYDKQAIYYTTNGDLPTSATGIHYSDPVDTLPIQGIVNCQTGAIETKTLKFMGYDILGNEGPVGTAVYTIEIVC
jgi:hypothetical protein